MSQQLEIPAPPLAAPRRVGRGGRQKGAVRQGLRVPTWALTAAGGVVWLIVNPPTPDLAAHEYRAEIVRRVGIGIWDQGWYAGHPLPSYSVLMPPLAALITPQGVGALAVVVASWCFTAIAQGHWHDDRAVVASAWFSIGVLSVLLGGQLAFAAGLAPGLGALLAAQRGRHGLAAGLAAATTLTSPVASAFLVMAALAWWLATRTRAAVWVAAGAVIPGLALTLAFQQGGTQPFSFSSFMWSLVLALLVAIAVPRDERTIRIGALLYAASLLAAVAIDTPLGGNLVRAAAVFGGPLAAGALWNRRMFVLVVIAVPLVYWQWLAPVRSVLRGRDDPSSSAAYHAPLLAELDRLQQRVGPFRIEIPFTANHWETRYIAPDHPLARGWERQLDLKLNPLFYERGALTPASYRRWLDDLAVRYVALPGVELDPSSLVEGRLVRDGLVPGLHEVWHGGDWRLYRVTPARPLASGQVRVTRYGIDDLALDAARPATSTLRVRYTPYWALVDGSGCVSRTPDGWTRVRLDRPGAARLAIRFSLTRIRATSARCTS